MTNGKFDLENLASPPEKVRLMFDAVTELISEKADIGSMKVQDITARAGIGKGTAYEYFSSKEELIMMALLSDYGKKLTELETLLKHKAHFADKMYGILDWLHDNSGYHMTFIRMLQVLTGGEDFCRTLKGCIPENMKSEMHTYLLKKGDAIMEQGYQEGVFTETDIGKRRLAFSSMVVQAALATGENNLSSIYSIEYGKMREFVYRAMVGALS